MRRLAHCVLSNLLYISVTLTEDRCSAIHPSTNLRVCVYAKKSPGKDILAGTLEIPFDSLQSFSQSGL